MTDVLLLLLSRSVHLSTTEQLHGIETGIVMSRYLATSWHHYISRYTPLRYWYRNVDTHDTYRGIEGIAQHYKVI